ncbi:MAG: glycosyltransferase [Dehalococcoidia bacterium]|nr:glycosyltransferase [Dehalococcoidia bacterium]
MRIAFRGNFRPRTAAGEPFSTESHVSATMELLGHQVLRIQEDTVPWADVPRLCESADLFWWTATWHVDFPGGFRALDAIKALRIPTVSHTLDLFVGLSRAPLLDTDPWFRTDYVFSPDGGHDEIFAAKGINHFWIPPAVFEPECYLAEPVPGLAQDVIFVGSYGYHPEWPYRRELIDWLRTTYWSRFTHYDHASGMRGHRLNQLYASAKVVVGDSCCPGFTQTHYTSDRFFETPGRGGFLIAPHIVGIDHLVDREHVVLYSFGDFGQLKRLVDYCLEHDAHLARLRLAGHEHVKAHHTYTHRVKAMLAIVAQGEGRA